MDPSRSTATVLEGPEALFKSFVQGERGGKLRSQLAKLHPHASGEEIEDAIQAACDRFVDKAEGITEPGQVYAWLRTTAHRILNREDDYHERELAVDPTTETGLQQLAGEQPGPEEETIEHEDEAELVALVREVSESLPEQKREVLTLYSSGLKRPEIASRLGMSDRAVKRDLLEIMDEARTAIARKAGGGCLQGEPLVLRFAYGLASAAEAEQAHLHMKGCRRCEVLAERLDAWREKAAAILPLPAVEQASPGLLGRVAHRAADGFTTAKQQILGGASQAKQQAAAGYSRAVDPTPLAGARPGTLAAVILSCATIGGGAATYCAQNNVDPLSAATGLIGGEEEPNSEPTPQAEETPEATTVVPPPAEEAPVAEEPVAAEPSPAAEPEPKPEPEPAPPPPEQSFEPASPDYPAAEAGAEYEATESALTESTRPAPVSGGGAPQFGGP
ncbi:MAG TPA: sigma-70 family RNA polymerase sigma factor [Solirubrobacterales bacterium]|nr:sigma-70 family RNA polymerase sigma factor [Solirubrobacterales bacterium]